MGSPHTSRLAEQNTTTFPSLAVQILRRSERACRHKPWPYAHATQPRTTYVLVNFIQNHQIDRDKKNEPLLSNPSVTQKTKHVLRRRRTARQRARPRPSHVPRPTQLGPAQ